MGIADRLARLERQMLPPAEGLSDRLAAALDAARRRIGPKTNDQRARHQAALNASPPSPLASELAHRLHSAKVRLARDFFSKHDSAADNDPGLLGIDRSAHL